MPHFCCGQSTFQFQCLLLDIFPFEWKGQTFYGTVLFNHLLQLMYTNGTQKTICEVNVFVNCDNIYQGCTNSGNQVTQVSTFLKWCLTFVGTPYETCFMPPFLCLELCGGSWIFGKFVHSSHIWRTVTSPVKDKPSLHPVKQYTMFL
jgi:hypothetical protein